MGNPRPSRRSAGFVFVWVVLHPMQATSTSTMVLLRHALLRLLLLTVVAAGGSFNIMDYGAVADGKALCTDAFKKSVAAAVLAGGGSVVVPAGRFLTGSFSLASHVFLELSTRQSEVLGSNRVDDYPAANWDWDPALIDTRNATDTGLRGVGSVNGQALPLWVKGYDPLRGFIPMTWTGVYGWCVHGARVLCAVCCVLCADANH